MDAKAKLLSPLPHRQVSSQRTNLLQAFLDLSSDLSQWPEDLETDEKQRVWTPERQEINPLVYDQVFLAVSEAEAFPWDVVAS